MQQDAIERLNLRQLLLEPEMMEAIEPDIHMVTTLLALNRVMPDEARATARMVVRKVVDDLLYTGCVSEAGLIERDNLPPDLENGTGTKLNGRLKPRRA